MQLDSNAYYPTHGDYKNLLLTLQDNAMTTINKQQSNHFITQIIKCDQALHQFVP